MNFQIRVTVLNVLKNMRIVLIVILIIVRNALKILNIQFWISNVILSAVN